MVVDFVVHSLRGWCSYEKTGAVDILHISHAFSLQCSSQSCAERFDALTLRSCARFFVRCLKGYNLDDSPECDGVYEVSVGRTVAPSVLLLWRRIHVLRFWTKRPLLYTLTHVIEHSILLRKCCWTQWTAAIRWPVLKVYFKSLCLLTTRERQDVIRWQSKRSSYAMAPWQQQCFQNSGGRIPKSRYTTNRASASTRKLLRRML